MEKDNNALSTSKVLKVSFWFSVLDIIIYAVVAMITGSAVLLSELLQGLADFTAGVFLLVGHRASKKPAAFEHPFGYGKEAFFWSLIATLFIFGVASIGSIVRGYQQLVSPAEVRHDMLGLIVILIGVATNFYSAYLSYKKISKPNVKFLSAYRRSTGSAVKTSFISDLIGSIAAVVALIAFGLFQITGNIIFDALGAIFVGGVLGVLSLVLAREIKGYLIGRAAPRDTQDQIIDIVEQVKGVVEVVDLKTMFVGPGRLLINVEVNLEDNLITDQVEEVMDKIREKVHLEVPEASHIQIEAESPDLKVHLHEEIEQKTAEEKKEDIRDASAENK